MNNTHIPDTWIRGELTEKPLILRDDGFTQFCWTENMGKEALQKRCIDYLEGTNVKVKEWGLGPGSVFTFDTKVGDVFGRELSNEQLAMLRQVDRNVHQNVERMIREGEDPLRIAVTRGHQIGLKVWARFEMNHEFGPASDDNWMWVGLVGRFNKQNPQFRISGSVRLDFAHEPVRAFKLAIIEEALSYGIDGISMDFAVYPPFLSHPKKDASILTRFVQDVRTLADTASKKNQRSIDVIVRVPYNGEDQGLLWKQWIDKDLIDGIIPTVVSLTEKFDVPVDAFVKHARHTRCKVFGCIRPYMGYMETDSVPQDDQTDAVRHDRAMLDAMFRARAMLLLRAGVDGLQIATGSGDLVPDQAPWKRKVDAYKPIYNELGDPKRLLKEPKEYIVNRSNQLPVSLSSDHKKESVKVRIADAIGSREDTFRTQLVLFCRKLSKNETICVRINGYEAFTITADAMDDSNGAPLDISEGLAGMETQNRIAKDENWWKKGMHVFEVPSGLLVMGENIITLEYETDHPNELVFRITDMNVQVIPCQKGATYEA